jgi:hypothetical protein
MTHRCRAIVTDTDGMIRHTRWRRHAALTTVIKDAHDLAKLTGFTIARIDGQIVGPAETPVDHPDGSP